MDYDNYSAKLTTEEPGVSMTALEENIPTLTVASIIGVALVVLVAIAMVFVLGILIDCRQQRLLDEKNGRDETCQELTESACARARCRRCQHSQQRGGSVL